MVLFIPWRMAAERRAGLCPTAPPLPFWPPYEAAYFFHAQEKFRSQEKSRARGGAGK
jgi:hypothetical protein